MSEGRKIVLIMNGKTESSAGWSPCNRLRVGSNSKVRLEARSRMWMNMMMPAWIVAIIY